MWIGSAVRHCSAALPEAVNGLALPCWPCWLDRQLKSNSSRALCLQSHVPIPKITPYICPSPSCRPSFAPELTLAEGVCERAPWLSQKLYTHPAGRKLITTTLPLS